MELLRAMRVFVRVAEAASFTAAGQQLGIAPAQVSRAITELETHLRARLLNRTMRRVALTESGERYLERCKAVIELVDVSEAEAGNAQSSPSGVLRVHTPITFGQHYVVPALTRYLSDYPLVRVELTLSQHQPDILEEGYDVLLQFRRRSARWRAQSPAYLEGLGIAPLPMLSALPYLQNGAIVRVLPEWDLQQMSVFAMYASRQYLDAKIRTWIDFLKAFVHARLHPGET